MFRWTGWACDFAGRKGRLGRRVDHCKMGEHAPRASPGRAFCLPPGKPNRILLWSDLDQYHRDRVQFRLAHWPPRSRMFLSLTKRWSGTVYKVGTSSPPGFI